MNDKEEDYDNMESFEKSDQAQLIKMVIQHSEGDTWKDAKKEWKLVTIHHYSNNCICGHDIYQNCVIRNKNNQNELIVGNVCINHFDENGLKSQYSSHRLLSNLIDGSIQRASSKLLDLCVETNVLLPNEKVYYQRLGRGKDSKNRFDPSHNLFDNNIFNTRRRTNNLIILGLHSARPKCFCNQYAKPRQNPQTKLYFYSCYGPVTKCHFFAEAVNDQINTHEIEPRNVFIQNLNPSNKNFFEDLIMLGFKYRKEKKTINNRRERSSSRDENSVHSDEEDSD